MAITHNTASAWEGEFVYFRNVGKTSDKAKTDTWFVYAKSGETGLGSLRWFGRWRKYCFFPMADTVFEEKCLRDIAEFIVKITKEYKSRGENGEVADLVPTSPLVIPPIRTARKTDDECGRQPDPRPRRPSCY